MKSMLFIIASAAILCGCEPLPAPTTAIDQCMRHEIFKQCMNLLPAGPQATKYNDWDEVVAECDTTAYRQSERLIKYIKPECSK